MSMDQLANRCKQSRKLYDWLNDAVGLVRTKQSGEMQLALYPHARYYEPKTASFREDAACSQPAFNYLDLLRRADTYSCQRDPLRS